MHPRIVITGTGSGSGKTTVTMGLLACIGATGATAQPFKAGADVIDPGYHTAAAGRPCRNLDTMLLPRNRLLELFSRSAPGGGLSIIEGVMGLFDGAGARDERGSTARLAKLLASPVILTVNGKAMGRSAAALVAGFASFDPETKIKGVIFNNLGSERHYRLLKETVEGYTGIPVLGWLPRNDDVALPERRLGLLPAGLHSEIRTLLGRLKALVEEYIDVNEVISIARSAPPLPAFEPSIFVAPSAGRAVIAAASDEAFCFPGRDNHDILQHLGAEIKFFSPLEDACLPPGAAGVFFDGDFPEELAPRLAENLPMKKALREAAEAGMPILAGSGGLKLLAERFTDKDGSIHTMAGVLPGSVGPSDRLALGYCSGRLTRAVLAGEEGDALSGRLFHYSTYDPGGIDDVFSLALEKDGAQLRDGPARGNVFASLLNLHFGTNFSPAARLIRIAERYGQKK